MRLNGASIVAALVSVHKKGITDSSSPLVHGKKPPSAGKNQAGRRAENFLNGETLR
jgi:hypothetical protein